MGGAPRIGQLQVRQPFVTCAIAVPLRRERIDAATVVAVVVALGLRAGVRMRAAPPAA